MKIQKVNLLLVSKPFLLFIVLFQLNLKSSAQITEIYTDFGGYWKSTSTTNNSTQPNLSNNVLAFTYNNVIYSTGVSDSTLNAHSLTITAGTYKALPISSIGGTIATANSTFISLPSDDDGVPNGTKNPLPSVRMNDVLTDGINGLNIASGVTNIPLNASMTFPVSTINTSAISDAQPDILYSEIAAIGGNPDTLYFVDASGTRIGNVIAVTWSSVPVLGNYTCDLYTLTTGATCDNAIITGVNGTFQSKQIRLTAYKLSDFGITSTNASSVVNLKIKPGGASDPAFLAYNAGAFFIATPVITTQPVTQVVCPGTSQNAVFSVSASGTGVSYQWRKNGVNISGATSSTYTITNVAASDAAAYDVIITNTAGSIQSTIAYLNTYITTQPSPSTQTIATGNTVTLSVTAGNATGFQWKRNGTNISGATSSSLVLSPLTTTNGGTFTVSVINSANSGCSTILSSAAIVIPATTLYSKNTVLNAAANWTVNSDGSSGSAPLDFTRAEDTFVVRSNAATTGSLTIAGTLDESNAVTTITNGTTLSAGRIIRSGTTGTLTGSSTSSLMVGSTSVSGNSDLYFTTGNELLQNFTIAQGGTVTLHTALNITAGSTPGILTVNSGGVLNTSGLLDLKSDAGGTAIVGAFAGTINGNVTVERYMPERRAWRLMTVPLTSTSTIRNSWQNGGVYAPGIGTCITGTSGTGYDSIENASIYGFNTSTQSFTGLPSTYVNISAGNNGSADNTGYMIFIRGDRNQSNYYPPSDNNTTLSCSGKLQTGPQIFTAATASGKYTLIGNPYASPIDFNNVTRTNLVKRFYTWDPTLNTVGGFVVLDDLDGDGIFTSSVAGSAQGKDIQSGQAFIVQTLSGGAASLEIDESSKSTVNNTLIFRPESAMDNFRTDLYLLNPDSSLVLADGADAQFDNSFLDTITVEDAPKLSNTNEDLSYTWFGKAFSIERRPLLSATDSIPIKVAATTPRSYRFNFTGNNPDRAYLTGLLMDNYTGKTTSLNLNGVTPVDFNVTTDAASSSANRFVIEFRPAGVVPVTFTSVNAYTKNATVNVTWKIANEINIAKYEVERSTDDNNFTVVGTVKTTGNNSSGVYNWIDGNPVAGNDFYRILSIGTDGGIQYSQTVKVTIDTTASSISIYPNPIIGNKVDLQMNNMPGGIYKFRLLNTIGQIIQTGTINNPGGIATEDISLGNGIAKGVYQLELDAANGKKISISFINNQ